MIRKVYNYMLMRKFESYIGNSLNRYLDVLNLTREILEENGERHDELEQTIERVVDAIKNNDVMTHKGRLLMPDGLVVE